MATRKARASKQDRAFARGVNRIDLAGKMKPPLDPIPEFEPKKHLEIFRFEAVIDPAIQLTEDAAKRIEKQLRHAVLIELAQLELPEMVVTGALRSRSRGIEVRLVRQ